MVTLCMLLMVTSLIENLQNHRQILMLEALVIPIRDSTSVP